MTPDRSAPAPATPPESEIRTAVRRAFAAADNLPAADKLAVDEGLVDWSSKLGQAYRRGSSAVAPGRRLEVLKAAIAGETPAEEAMGPARQTEIAEGIRDWRDQSVKAIWTGSYRLVKDEKLSLLQIIYLARSLYHLCADRICQKKLPARYALALAETLEEVGREDVADVFRYLETYVIPGTGAMPHPSDAVLRAVVPALARIYSSRRRG